jgi:hypothetical protein
MPTVGAVAGGHPPAAETPDCPGVFQKPRRRPTCKVKKVLANSEPSTHATKCEMLTGSATVWLRGATESLGHTRE